MGNLKGHIALVTGGSNGIGRAIVRSLADAGCLVFFTYRQDHQSAQNLCDDISLKGQQVGCCPFSFDHGISGFPELLENVKGKYGCPDILVNNAAFASRSAFLDMTLLEYQKTMGINVEAPFFLSQLVAKHLIEEKKRGSFINISSISAFKAISQMSAYQSSKAALSMMTKSLAYELSPYQIRVNTISPGLTQTNSNRVQWQNDPDLWKERSKDIPLGRTGLPEDIASAAVFLASDQSSWMTGADLVIDGGDSVI